MIGAASRASRQLYLEASNGVARSQRSKSLGKAVGLQLNIDVRVVPRYAVHIVLAEEVALLHLYPDDRSSAPQIATVGRCRAAPHFREDEVDAVAREAHDT